MLLRYALLGAAGQLGRDLAPRLAGEVTPLVREQADLTRPEMLRAALEQARPDVIVNCAAYNLVDKAEAEPQPALAVNTWGVRELARICGERGWTLVHFSTDHVFGLNEKRRQAWGEEDLPGPVSVYGLSKLAGEYFVRSLCPRHYVIRTCGLYGVPGSGGKGGNFVETMLRLAGQGKPLRVVADQVCTPTSTVALAEAVVRLLAAAPFGLYHLTCTGECSWHDFAAAIFQLAGVSAQLTAITAAEFGAAARRPTYSVLENAAARRVGLAPLPAWRDALAEYLRR
jgi:dTDP-4-dehydrorhamnose reductase